MIHYHIRPSSPVIVANRLRHAFLAMPDKLRKKSFFSFLFLCLVQPVYSMENDEGFFARIFNKLHGYTLYFPFCKTVELALENNDFTQKNFEIIKDYIKKGADPNWKIGKNENTVLSLAIFGQQKDLFDFLLQNNADINACAKNGQTPLHHLVLTYGIYEKLDITIKDLIQHGANIKATEIDGFTPLHTAVWKRNINCIKSLVEYGADINANSTGMTPYYWLRITISFIT
jgi:Ankyrin repeats (3 copies)